MTSNAAHTFPKRGIAMQFRRKALGGVLALGALASAGLLVGSCSQQSALQLAPEPSSTVSTFPSRIAITIDDLPYVMPSRTSPQEGLRYVKRINTALNDHGIVATGFAVGQQITPKTIPALRAFADAGHTIGNHSWSHPDYDTLTPTEFRTETARTDEILTEWISTPRYYRFPYLREGETEQAKHAAKQVLAELGYRNVPVTIDNDEWQFNADYFDALDRGDATLAAKVARLYIAHMQERTAHFQNLARDELGSDVSHILLIHLNRINADHLMTLLDWYAAEGWTFITIQDALSDPVFSKPDLYEGARGLSQIERVLGGKSE
jgi:peptidoglycan/xylan/chitin deacetylase (PgdA/CDA1 family)